MLVCAAQQRESAVLLFDFMGDALYLGGLALSLGVRHAAWCAATYPVQVSGRSFLVCRALLFLASLGITYPPPLSLPLGVLLGLLTDMLHCTFDVSLFLLSSFSGKVEENSPCSPLPVGGCGSASLCCVCTDEVGSL